MKILHIGSMRLGQSDPVLDRVDDGFAFDEAGCQKPVAALRHAHGGVQGRSRHRDSAFGLNSLLIEFGNMHLGPEQVAFDGKTIIIPFANHLHVYVSGFHGFADDLQMVMGQNQPGIGGCRRRNGFLPGSF